MNNDLISRSALKKALEVTQYNDIDDLTRTERLIDNAPTVKSQKIVTIPPELIEKLASCVVDIVGNIDWDKAIEAYKARPQGEWKGNNFDEHVCSLCGHYALYEEEPDDYYEVQSNFCPNCGADMRGGRE